MKKLKSEEIRALARSSWDEMGYYKYAYHEQDWIEGFVVAIEKIQEECTIEIIGKIKGKTCSSSFSKKRYD